jgi:hypothetical protein
MDFFEAIRIQALRDVISGSDQDYLLRKIHRWYSKTFSTPLHEALDLPLEDVVRAWFEERFEGLESEQLEELRQEILETPSEREARLRVADAEAAEADEFAKLVEEEEAEKAKTKKAVVPQQKIIAPSSEASKVIVEKERQEEPLVIHPDIHFQFIEEDELAAEVEKGTMTQPEKRVK